MIVSPSPWPVGVPVRSPVQSLERLEETLELGDLDTVTRVADRNLRPTLGDARRDVDRPSRDVVPECVVEQVRDHALDQLCVAVERRGRERGSKLEASAFGLCSAGADDRLGKSRQVERLGVLEPALAAREGQQSFDEPFLLAAECERFDTGGSQGLGVGVGIGERDLQQCPLPGERRAELVGGVRDEVTLRLERCLEPREEAVEDAAEVGELVLGAVKSEPPVQIRGGDLLRGGGDDAQWSEEPAGKPPGSGDRSYDDDDDDASGAGIELLHGRRVWDERGRAVRSAALSAPEEEVLRLEQDAGTDEYRGDDRKEHACVKERDLDAQRRAASASLRERADGGHRGAAIR